MEDELNSLKDNVGYSTTRGFKEYAQVFGFDEKLFLGWLNNHKRVLDISSGGGLLKKDLEIMRSQGVEVKSLVTSLDLAYATQEGRNFENYSTHLAFSRRKAKVSKQDLSEVNKLFRGNSVGASFADLPFSSSSFDGILASYSFGEHSDNINQLIRSYVEVGRVLKPSGEGYITVKVEDLDEGLLKSGDIKNPIFYTLSQISFLKTELNFIETLDEKGHLQKHYYLKVNKD